jgi:hypothetical protein
MMSTPQSESFHQMPILVSAANRVIAIASGV